MRRGILSLALGSVWIAPGALAQDRAALPPGAVVQPLDTGAGSELRGYLATIAQNPRDVNALNGAGAAALDMGDPNAAFNFFTRAADADPSSARARAGMAQALVRMERASEALPLFTEAARMGMPEAQIAGDRGLAWDVLGYPARAQADYALALRRADDPEIRRRLALSLAISGQRAEALRIIEAQLRANDRAAWRTQAFILALTGDPAGADRTVRGAMPGAADALAPFLQRMASLSPSQKALAVHFGHFPSDGRAQRYAQADSVADPGALAMARGNVAMGQAPVRSGSTAPRRRPDSETSLAMQIRPAPSRSAEAAPRRQYSGSAGAPSFVEPDGATGEGGPAPQRYASAQSGSQAPAWPTPVLDERQSNYPSRPPSPPPAATPRPTPGFNNTPNQYEPQNDARSPGFGLVPQGQPFGKPPENGQSQAQPQPRAPADFSIVTSAVNSLEDDRGEVAPPVQVAPPVRSQPARTTRSAAAQPAPSRTRQTPSQANPSRAWVQVATGSNRAGLLFTYGQFRRRAPQLLNGRAAWAGPNRLLVGPFPTEAAAGSFARQLSARGVPSHSWTSEAGQRIDQLQAAASSDDTPATTRTRTAASERSSPGSRNGRSGARGGKERTTASGNGRNERSASNGSGRNRNGTGNSRTGSGRNSTAGNSGRNGTGNGRNGRSNTANTRTASAGTSRNGGGGRSGARNGAKPATSASARSSRGGSSGQRGSSTRRGR